MVKARTVDVNKDRSSVDRASIDSVRSATVCSPWMILKAERRRWRSGLPADGNPC